MRPLGLCFALILSLSAGAVAADPASWRSALYPEDWRPGFADDKGRFLHDFSYAGYHRGEQALPDVQGPVTDVTKAPYQADATGAQDVTEVLQKALDDVGKAGGGVVFLPAGTYRIQPPAGASTALKIRSSHVVLRGAGADKTFVFNDNPVMRDKHVIEMRADQLAWWYPKTETGMTLLTSDLMKPTDVIPVADVAGLKVGDLIVLRADLTPRFIEEHGMTGKWTSDNLKNHGIAFGRRVLSIDSAAKTVKVDVPTRYPLRMEDNARLVRVGGTTLEETAIEDLSIGMKQNPGEGWLEEDHSKQGTGAYDVASSVAVYVESVENCWLRRVHSYCPAGNKPEVHLLSNGIKLVRSRFVTVTGCDLRHAQYKGGNGNGYLYNLQGQECLIVDCNAEYGRHNYDFGNMVTSGNVITHCTTRNGALASDFHMYLSMANLIDGMICDGDFLEAKFRPYGNPIHGMSTTQSVYWNTKGLKYTASPFEYNGGMHTRPQVLIESKQFGDGYVIGTSGPADKVDSTNFVEGVGKGDTLIPQSLYQDQLKRRLGK